MNGDGGSGDCNSGNGVIWVIVVVGIVMGGERENVIRSVGQEGSCAE